MDDDLIEIRRDGTAETAAAELSIHLRSEQDGLVAVLRAINKELLVAGPDQREALAAAIFLVAASVDKGQRVAIASYVGEVADEVAIGLEDRQARPSNAVVDALTAALERAEEAGRNNRGLKQAATDLADAAEIRAHLSRMGVVR